MRKNGTLRELRLGNNWVGNQASKWVSKYGSADVMLGTRV